MGLLEQHIRKRCRQYGVETYLDDRDLYGGDKIPDELKAEIRGSDEMLIFLTKYSAASSWVKNETGAAWVLDMPIVVIVDKITPQEMPEIVAPYKAIDVNDFETTYIKQLAARARGVKRK